MVTLRVAVVISPVCTSWIASNIASSFSSRVPSGIKRSMAAKPCGALRVGITTIFFTLTLAAFWAAKMMFLLFGKMMILSVGKFSNAATISFTLGFIVCPPVTMAATPKLANMREIPSPGETATTAICPGVTGASLIGSFSSLRDLTWSCKFSIATFLIVPKLSVYSIGVNRFSNGTWICMR